MASCCRPFVEPRRARARPRLRGLSLIEVMVSQVIAIVVIAGMMSLVVAMIRKLDSEASVADAQIHLRQVSHLMLRDTQGVGGEISTSGDMVFITDGGASAADQLAIFRRDESICGGLLGVDGANGVTLDIDGVDDPGTAATTVVCPIGLAACPESELEGRMLVVAGTTRSIAMTGHNAVSSPGACKINYPPGQQQTDVVAAFNARYGTSVRNMNELMGAMQPISVLIGSSFTYRLNGTTLQRSTSNGTFEDILDNVFDFQIEQVYFDDDATNLGTTYVRATTGTALPEGFESDEFIGLRIGIVTFAPARADLEVKPPAQMSNRDLSGAPGKRRYRASFVLAASRNRSDL
jgi:hypothetical protein